MQNVETCRNHSSNPYCVATVLPFDVPVFQFNTEFLLRDNTILVDVGSVPLLVQSIVTTICANKMQTKNYLYH